MGADTIHLGDCREVLQSLPEASVDAVVHTVDNDRDQFRALAEKAIRLAEGYKGIKEWHLKGQASRDIENGLRQAAGISKAPYVAAFVRSLLEAGERVLLCAHHQKVHELLGTALSEFKPHRVTGTESPTEKQASIQAFATGETNLIQLALRSAAGIDGLQGRGSCVVFAELDWSPAVHSQAEDRLHRMGADPGSESILVYYLVCEEGIDETMQEALGLKIGQFVGIMGDAPESMEERLISQRAGEAHIQRVIERLAEASA